MVSRCLGAANLPCVVRSCLLLGHWILPSAKNLADEGVDGSNEHPVEEGSLEIVYAVLQGLLVDSIIVT